MTEDGKNNLAKSWRSMLCMAFSLMIILTSCSQTPETKITPTSESSTAALILTGEELIEKLFQDGFSCSTKADFSELYNSIPQQQANGLTAAELQAFITLFKTKMQRLTENVTCEATLTNRQSLQSSDGNNDYRTIGNFQWLADVLIDQTPGQEFYRLKFITNGDLLNPIIYIFFLDKQADIAVLPVNFIRGLINLPQQVKELESIIKSGDSTLLEPYTRLGLINDLSVVHRKAQMEIDLYSETIKANGEKQLAIDTNRILSETDEVPGQATLIWQGDLDSSQTSVMPKLISAFIARDGQLKIRQPFYFESSYFPAKEVTSHGQTLKIDEEYDQMSIVKFFGTALAYRRDEPETFFFTNTPMQTHYFGQNSVTLVGKRSQDLQNYAGYIRQINLSEGAASLAGEVELGANIQDVLAAWPLLEDFYVPAYAGGHFGTDYADVISLDMEQNFSLRIKDGLLNSIHMELFAD